MLAGILLPVAEVIQFQSARLNHLSEKELRIIHHKYKGLIKWITKNHKVNEVFNQKLIDKIIAEDVVTMRSLLMIDDEEAMIIILIAANIY